MAGPLMGASTAGATPPGGHGAGDGGTGGLGDFTDEMFDWEAVIAGAWDEPFYGRGDERGTLHEITEAKTASALQIVSGAEPVKRYWMGEELFEGFPAFPQTPPREHVQRLLVLGYQPPPDFDGILVTPTPLGPNLVTYHEERYDNYTYQIATQTDGLNHVGVGPVYYGGHRVPDITADWGTTALGNETMGPIVTRGVILDIVGLKVAQGASEDVFEAPNGKPVLRDDYRITVEDIHHAMWRQRLESKPIRAGDVVIFNTGWTHLVHGDPARYLAQEPGIYLRESRYLASKRPAIIASDTFGLEVLSPEVTGGFAFPVHQELLTKHGIRIGEGYVTQQPVEDNCFEIVFILGPQRAPGATAAGIAPIGLGRPGPPPR